ncbi:hypothetical protein DFJ74DRAFT_749895 [Hyaloraphidium curvatum]|nr:hypothetical protein DFJ74DRAFT_749895 [Hyaloraphidium curvatum]
MAFRYEPVPQRLQRPHLRLYLDTASPFSYLAAVVMLRLRDDPASPWRGKADFEFVPISLPEVRKRADNWPGPPAIRKKARYLALDMVRDRRTYRVPLVPNPAAFPARTEENLLLLTHIKVKYGEKASETATMALFEAYWVKDQDPAKDAVMEECAGKAVPGGPAKVREILKAIRKDGKQEKEWLEKWTTECADSGAFGAPWFKGFAARPDGSTEEQVFFGSDRFEHIADFFGLPWKGYITSPESTPVPPPLQWPPPRKPKL